MRFVRLWKGASAHCESRFINVAAVLDELTCALIYPAKDGLVRGYRPYNDLLAAAR